MPARSAHRPGQGAGRLRRRHRRRLHPARALEAKLERFPDQLERACVELAKDWRTDRYLRRLEALLAVADASAAFC
jgi:hypothetical protein